MYYGLKSPAANGVVDRIVSNAILNRMPWHSVYRTLATLAKSDPYLYREVLNQRVLEWIYDEIGAGGRGEPFYLKQGRAC